ncbi:MAG: hypothetical protein HN474_09430 [Nitrospina sp.]|nr:hypothetical protein [Nitrospina sp.]
MKGFFFKISILNSFLSKWTSFFLFIFLFAVPTVEAIPFSQEFKKDSDLINLKVKSIVDPENIKPGDRFVLYITIELSEGWHIYSLYTEEFEKQPLATKIFLNSDIFVPNGLWEETPYVMEWDGALGKVVKTHQKVVEFQRWYSSIDSLSSGSYKLKGDIIFRACNNKICNLPKKISYETKVNILGHKK